MAEVMSLREKLAYWRTSSALNISPSAMPSRRNSIPPRVSEGANAWERGVATDHRGLPYLDMSGQPIPIKKFAEKRHVYEEAIRANANGALSAKE